jgi:putative membrane protein
MIMKIKILAKNFLYGIILGVSNVIPGVSGGTMAVILNIYDTVLLAFTRQNFKKSLPLLVPLGAGTIVGIYFFSHLITGLMEEHRPLLAFAFAGIILGSIPAIYKRARYEKAKPKNLLLGLIALTLMIILSFVSNDTLSEATFLSWDFGHPLFYVWIFISSALAMIAMLLPGISGSLVLLILGAYTIAMEAIAYFQWNILLVLALGVLVGGYTGVKGIQNMLRDHPQALYFTILGLVAGSLFFIFIDMKNDLTSPLNYFIFILLLAISFIFSHKKNDNPL